ncbi:hypothetical protein [Acidicapsa ligni]|uniref:hypothetical protein n=1 Tax=Acidicapsa ligni TaxID=542300 RepID=UPI0021E09162|nr:hypothetical protein [Acidicapsa ligni]
MATTYNHGEQDGKSRRTVNGFHYSFCARSNILVIGTDRKRLSSYQRVADKLGCCVHASSSAHDLHQKLSDHRIGLVIVDSPAISALREWTILMQEFEQDARLRILVVCQKTISTRFVLALGAMDCLELTKSKSARALLPWIDTYLPSLQNS